MTDNETLADGLRVKRRADGFWIEGGELPMGPWNVKSEADEICEGVQRFLRDGHRRGFVTVDSPRRSA